MSQKPISRSKAWSTRFYTGILKLTAYLPWSIQVLLARAIGRLLYLAIPKRRKIVDVNLKLCFPQWSDDERADKVKEVFFENALGFLEASNGFFRSPKTYQHRVTVSGLDLLEQAKAEGRGVLLLGAHYSHLDFGGALVSLFTDVEVIYRPNDNPVLDDFIQGGRHNYLQGTIHRNDIRGIARSLKKGHVVWYPPDQDYGPQHSVFAPFFGVNAATITATSRLVKLNKSPVLSVSYFRDTRGHYQLTFESVSEAFPSGDDGKDAELINHSLEQGIGRAPTQYMWTHRRFKTQPEGGPDYYR